MGKNVDMFIATVSLKLEATGHPTAGLNGVGLNFFANVTVLAYLIN